ncbi:MAG: hypothetical protein QM762_03245 [Chryseolinea sp.]
MNTITIIAILLMSLFFTIAFVVVLKSRGPWGSGWSFFTINLLWLAAVSLWIPPAGPVWYGAPWIDLFVTGLLLSFLLSATPGATSSSNIPTDDLSDDNNSDITKQSSSGPHGASNSTTVAIHSEAKKDAEFSNVENHTASRSRITLNAGGVFWMLLLCLCALIIIGAA